jgi:carbon monoxide dehydrogenase subunit G
MELTNEFHVPTPIDRAWKVLTDIELIAPCMPGAALEEIEGDEFRGGVKIKVGPITAQYQGKARFLEKDDTAHKAVLRAEGRDTKGAGNAAATITAQLTASGTGTDVKVTTDLTITGKVAQFGRGVLADVSAKLLGQFVQCLEHNVLAQPEAVAAEVAAAGAELAGAAAPATAGSAAGSAAGAAAAAGEAPAAPTVRKIAPTSQAAPVDLLGTAGSPVLKRLVPAGIGLLLVLWLLRRLRGSK